MSEQKATAAVELNPETVHYERTVTVVMSQAFIDTVGGLHNQNVTNAFGYLATWAIAGKRLPKCKLVGEHGGDIAAFYFNEKGEVGYEMFGLWDDKGAKYSFHS